MFLGAGAAAVAAAGAGTGVTLWVTRSNADQPGTGDSPVPRRHLSFGFLPDGYRSTAFGLDSRWESVTASPGGEARNVLTRVKMFRTGIAVPTDPMSPHDSAWRRGGGGQAVHGKPTRYAVVDTETSALVRVEWRYERNGWAQLDHITEDPDLAAALRIAAGIRLGAGTPVPLPVAASGLPAALRRQGIDAFDRGGDDWFYGVTYAPTPAPLGVGATYSSMTVTVSPMTASERLRETSPDAGGATTTIQGHPARRTSSFSGDDPEEALNLWDIGGCLLRITISGKPVRDLAGPDGVLTMWPHFQVTADRARWR
jgi:hypothetical protein